MKYKIAIFDLDGTTLNTLDDLCDSINYCLKYFSMPLRSLEEIRQFVGNGMYNLVRLSVPLGTSTESIDKFYNYFMDYYKIHCADKTKPYDGIIDILSVLKEKGMKIVCLSNKADEAVSKLCDKYFNGIFDFTLGDKKEINKKPSPDGVELILNRFNLNKNDVIYIGDSEVDYLTAKNSNVDLIMVNYGFRNKEELLSIGVNNTVDSPEEILNIILK